jgi:hypothetical protein
MFLNKKYILANELVQKMNIHIANISMLLKSYSEESDAFIKLNNCTFINTSNVLLPHNIKNGIATNSFTDITDKLPCSWFRTEFEVSDKELFGSGIAKDKIRIAGKEFFVFDQNFVSTMHRKIGYILTEQETKMCLMKKQILGSIKLSKNKYFVWY